MLAVIAGAIFAGVAVDGDGVDAGDVAGPGVAGAVCAGRLVCVGGMCGFGPKNLAQRMITPKDNSEATRIRSSGVNSSFCPRAFMSATPDVTVLMRLNSLASLRISPAPGRSPSCE